MLIIETTMIYLLQILVDKREEFTCNELTYIIVIDHP